VGNQVLLSTFMRWKLSGQAMTQFNKQKVYHQLLDRINNPHKINQGEASLCGPAATIYTLVRHRPDLYVKFGIEIFVTGQANVKNLNVNPRADMLAIKPGYNPDTKSTNPSVKKVAIDNINNDGYLSRMKEVDWLILAALRDSRNQKSTILGLKYDQVSDGTAGITLPGAIEYWYHKLGFRQVVNKTNLIFNKSFYVLYLMQEMVNSGHSVNIFVNGSIFETRTGSNYSFFPNHWVTLSSNILVDGKIITDSLARQLDSDYVDYINCDEDDDTSLSSTLPTFTHTTFFTVYTWGTQSWG